MTYINIYIYIWIEFVDIILKLLISQVGEAIFSVNDFCIQNITVSEHDNHSNSFQVKFPNVFAYYRIGEVRVEEKRLHS